MKFLSFLLLFCIQQFCVDAQYPPVGEVPPALQLEKVIKGPKMSELQLQRLKGKVVVIEFWATWCVPCVAAFPHINELAEKYKDKGVVFISVSTDKGPDAEEKINILLKTRPLNTYVVLDSNGLTREKYGASTIPTTYLINKEGKLDAVTYPSFLKEEHIENLINGKPSNVPQKKEQQWSTSDAMDTSGALFSLNIKEYKGLMEGTDWRKDKIHLTGMNTTELIAYLFDVEEQTVICDSSLQDKKWELEAKFPYYLSQNIRSILQIVVPKAIGIILDSGKRVMPVYVLKCSACPKTGAKGSLKEVNLGAGSYMNAGNGKLSATNYDFAGIVKVLESFTSSVIIDETGLKNRYDISLEFMFGDEPGVVAALRDCGIAMVKEDRSVDVIRVRK